MQNAECCLIPNYIYFNPSKQFVSSGKLFYREIKQSQQLKRVQSVSTKERWERALKHTSFAFVCVWVVLVGVWLCFARNSPIWETYLKPWQCLIARRFSEDNWAWSDHTDLLSGENLCISEPCLNLLLAAKCSRHLRERDLKKWFGDQHEYF